jgi:hypothetical protein
MLIAASNALFPSREEECIENISLLHFIAALAEYTPGTYRLSQHILSIRASSGIWPLHSSHVQSAIMTILASVCMFQ